MRKIGYGLLIAFLAMGTFSCNDDSDNYSLSDMWITIGNIEDDPDNKLITTDGGTKLFVSAPAGLDHGFELGDRLFINFTILADGKEGEDIDHYIKLNGYNEILTKEIVELSDDNAEEIGHDPIWFRNQSDDVYIANHFLNVDFMYEGAPWITHFINLVSDVENPTNEDGIPVLEIRHNANDDEYTNPPLRAFVSFDLKQLQEPGKTEVSFIVKSKGRSEAENFEKSFTYKYGEPEVSPMISMLIEDMSDGIE
ncbi:hypothetical protein [Carboxylicivirga sp. N1Y90]|uniref:NigD1/NigD2 family lipoprotein n=1 Tax=Carboxylicivirga fragile TaxID=3417571 RepID=UPI003D349386|nr:hypothetical protein [Marinilabiliaceae bacterium N1Y90]